MRLYFTSQRLSLFAVFLLVFIFRGSAQYPPAFTSNMVDKSEVDPLKRVYLLPQRVVWKSSDSLIVKPEVLLEKQPGQAKIFENRNVCRITNRGETPSGLILDFGKEIHGGLQITVTQGNNVTRKVRLRFGESVSEANSETMNIPKGRDSSTNHHAMRDFDLTLPGLGTIEVGNTGFRFVRIDLLEKDAFVLLKEIRAIAVYRDIPYLGSFKSSDGRLNKIWETGAYTVHLNMQDYLLDGIKRDRSVWAGDIHPEAMTIASVFGYNEVVPKSLDFLRDMAPLPKFMNGISTYSMWWVITHHDWYQFGGDLKYLRQQKSYLLGLLDLFKKYADEQRYSGLDSSAFLDLPSMNNKNTLHAGVYALLTLAFEKGAGICAILGETAKAKTYREVAARLRKSVPDHNQSKQAAALLTWAGMMDAGNANTEIIAVDGPKNFSAFTGYYMLQAQAKAGDYQGALDNIRKFWGGMLDLGATTFWEEFSLDEAQNAAPIDNIIPAGKKDYHRSTGVSWYAGFRRSLCHGWASGPTAWLSEHVLGVSVIEPGCKTVRIVPHLGDLQWAEGTFPTPYGVIKIRHEKQSDGTVKSKIEAPKQIKLIRK